MQRWRLRKRERREERASNYSRLSDRHLLKPRYLELITSTVALVALAQQAFATKSLSAPLRLVIDSYRALLAGLLGWADPYLQSCLDWFGTVTGWRMTIYPHWRDVLVILFVLVAASTRVEWRYGLKSHTLIIGIVGATSALAAALMVGVLPLQSESLPIQLVIAFLGSVPVMLTLRIVEETLPSRRDLTFDVGKTVKPVLKAFLTTLVFTSVALLATALLAYVFGTAAGFGLVGLAISVFVAGASVFFRGDPLGAMGRNIVGSFLGALCFFAIDAGLKLIVP